MLYRMRYVTAALIVCLVFLNCVIITKWLYLTECSLKGADSSVVLLRSPHRSTDSSRTHTSRAPAHANVSLAYDVVTARRNVSISTPHMVLIDFLHDFTSALPDDFDFNTLYWQFALQISSRGLYSEKSGLFIDRMLDSMSTSEILDLEQGVRGTQLKFFVTTADGAKSIIKVKKVNRDYVVPPDLFYFSEFERHHAEIAAYHLDRVLGFNRVPPCVGRIMNITGDIEPFADDRLKKTVFTSPAGNRCFHGECKYFCDTAHSVCGSPDLVEASMCVLLPYSTFPRKLTRSPWRRSYSKFSVAKWERPEFNKSYCRVAKDTDRTLRFTRRLLDVVDLYIFDFLTGNQDRHHYDSFEPFENHGAVIAIDNGRGFGRPYKDDFSILAPLYQCCQIRQSTYDKFSFLAHGEVSLSQLMQFSMAKDPLHKREPLLTKAQLDSLDRRVQQVLDVVHGDCIKRRKLSLSKVIIDDGL